MRVGVIVGIVTDVSVPGTVLLSPSVSSVEIGDAVSSSTVGTTVLKGTSVMSVGMNVGVVSGTVMSVGMNVGVVGTSGSPTVSSRRSGTTVLRGTTVSGAGIVGVVSNIVGSVGTTVGHVLVVSYPGSVSNVETPTFVLGLQPCDLRFTHSIKQDRRDLRS